VSGADVDVLVVGGGAVGLACGAALSRRGRRVVVLERHGGLARETTSRNSGVIHAGIYYPAGSLKAELCVEGRERLYARCERESLPHRQFGKVIVATSDAEVRVLEELLAKGRTNGAPGLELVDGAEVVRREPCVRAVAGLLSPRTGIVDAHAFCLSLAAELEREGGTVLLHNALESIERSAAGFRVSARAEGEDAVSVECGAVVNAAGLSADRVAALAGIDVDAAGYRQHPCKGDYFALAPSAPLRFAGLVYPVHGAAGLGVHVTLDLGGRVRFGPDAHYVEALDYAIDPSKAADFAEAAGRYLPGLRAEWLTPDQAGIRPKLQAPGQPFRDFVVAEESARGLPGLVNLVGIESPGLTASLAIAERVARLLGEAA
jgi:L-2-hydroxyglutarate oxidase LhgO